MESLDCAGEVVPVWLGLENCTLVEDVVLYDCALRALYLNSYQLPELYSQSLSCEGVLYLRKELQTTGKFDLLGVKIGGQLDCSQGRFFAGGVAVKCNVITVGADVFFGEDFKVRGAIDLIGAEISRNLDLSGATLTKDFIAQGMWVRA
ncbi:MAG: hypothetical protein P8Q19_00460 [Planktomarina sp.]|nr:hypothetical protein [Planktomarina sp.]MDG1504650.1 hypothetical protein [Planktomarina sp.]